MLLLKHVTATYIFVRLQPKRYSLLFEVLKNPNYREFIIWGTYSTANIVYIYVIFIKVLYMSIFYL